VLADNDENRQAAGKIILHATKSKHKETIHDNNYEGSTNRKLYKFGSKHDSLFKFLDDFNIVSSIIWPGYTPSEYQAFWSADDKTRRQAFHTDFNTFGEEHNIMAYAWMLSLDDNNYVWTFEEREGKRIYKRNYYPFGTMGILSGNAIHAGDQFCGQNFKLFKYVDSPNMKHGLGVTQIFTTFNKYTIELNKYM
jgi:hypothetical protein